MLPDYSRLLTCPHCGGKKEILSIASDNTFNGQVWSDTKTVYPMLPKVSFVQKCPHCGGYYLLSRQKEDDYADDFNGGTGTLSYPELKEAREVFSNDTTITDDEKKEILFHLLWAFNDEYHREQQKEVPIEEQDYINNIIHTLIPLVNDYVVKAELLREVGEFESAARLLAMLKEFYSNLMKKLDRISNEVDAKNSHVFVLEKDDVKETIELSKANYTDYLPIDIAAIAYATTGAMGECGGITIVGRDSQTYHLNHAYGDWDKEDVCTILPMLKECDLDLLGNGKYPDGWYERYMGFGNHLLIHKSILPEIIEQTKNIEDPAVLYQNWLRIVTEVLKNSN